MNNELDQSRAYEVGDTVLMNITVRPKWWQFWRKPYQKEEVFVCTSAGIPRHCGPVFTFPAPEAKRPDNPSSCQIQRSSPTSS